MASCGSPFKDKAPDGGNPEAGLIVDKWGDLYGTTEGGGTTGLGTVFEVSPPVGQSTQWSERVLWSFGVTGGDGVQPVAGLNNDQWGDLYGTTQGGGNAGFPAGTVFELSPPIGQQKQWNECLLWSFDAFSGDGFQPEAGLIADKRGNLYGTTVEGGANTNSCFGDGCGTAFELSPPTGKSKLWAERLLWSFGATSVDGVNPFAGLTADQWGHLYGTTADGGAIGDGTNGTVFELSLP
jgi:uncharacterized repeat protein (TIGR03803 family)